jgi:hypothetical protein
MVIMIMGEMIPCGMEIELRGVPCIIHAPRNAFDAAESLRPPFINTRHLVIKEL